MNFRILKVVLLAGLIAFLFVPAASADPGGNHIDLELSDPEPGMEEVKEPEAEAKSEHTPAKTETETVEKDATEEKAAAHSKEETKEESRTKKAEPTSHDEAEGAEHAEASYELIETTQPGYLFAAGIAIVVVVMFMLSVVLL